MLQNIKKEIGSNYNVGMCQFFFRFISCITFIIVGLQISAQTEVKLDFSQERGFSDVAFNLTITPTEPTAIIRYTLNGDEPSTTFGDIYTGSLLVDTTTVLRAIGYIIGTDTSKVYTHTYLFLDAVILQPEIIDGWPNNTYDIGSGNATAVHDYEMDPAIVNSSSYSADLIQGLKDIPSMSIVMPKNDFWDIYDGTSEKKTSIELLYFNHPDKNEQEDGGIEPHSHDRLKRSLRLSFKSEYGTANWDSDIFRNAVVGSETAENEFDRIVLRAGNNRAWSRNWNPDRTAFTRDEWFRQSQIAASGIGAHGTFVHLYVNGLYWGLYNPVERPDEAFTSTYLGGEKEDWFAISHGGNQGGNSTRYDYMMNNLLNTDLTQSSNYEELQTYLDIEKFSDYLLVSWMTGVQDWPNNNWWGGNRNTPAGPFMYFGWDNEWSWDVTNNANNGAWVHPQFESGDTGGNASARVFNKSKVNVDFKMAFADRAYKLCYNNGAMTDDNSRLRWSTLNDNIANAVVAESARWGDGIDDGVTRTRNEHWQDEVDRLDSLMNGNVDRLITALRDENYYPSIDPPIFENNSDTIDVQELSVSAGYAIDLANPNSNGDIYFTTNGIDPRMSGGAIDPSATLYSNQSLIINTSTNLLARVKVGSEWSALHCLNIIVNADLSWIKLTEIMYNPGDFGQIGGGELEFLEIKNTSTTLTLDISGLQIADGVDFTFPVGTLMDPQSFLIVASNETELLQKCPGISIFGEYEGALSNGGENIEFVTFVGDTIIRVEYDDKSPWPTEADGDGYSLVPTDFNPIGSQDSSFLWRISSNDFCGSPMADDVVCNASLIGTPCDDYNPNTINDVYDANCVCRGAPTTSPLLESEDATVGANWTVESDTEACGSEYTLPPNSTQLNEAPSLPEDHISFTFDVDVAATYKVYAKTMTTSGNDDSFWVRANGETWNSWNRINVGNYGNFYQWSQVGNWTSGDTIATPITFEFTAGSNTVDFAWREPGARLDKIFVTNEDLSVLNLVRNNDESGEFSFKYNVQEACPNDTIRFQATTDETPIIVDNNLISIDRTLTFIGNGTTKTILSGNELYQIFANTSTLSIHHLKMVNGFASSNGGAFTNSGTLMLKDVELEGNLEGTTPKAFTNSGTIILSTNSEIIIK
ncbi:CotH kinase family protein [Saprospiraceae bacterium]|nr:CotH kinase family protein [Saprospiraceae bacterium]